MRVFDYIIVGAGSAGSVLADRLSAKGDATVLVIEAGCDDRRFWIQTPIGYGKTYYDARVNWKYLSEPVPGLGGKQSYWPRGKVLGGSSSINAMVYVRGHPGDYDDWAETAPGWAWGDVAPIFKRMEDYAAGADEIRGAGGPVPVSTIEGEAHPLCQNYLEAARQSQLPVVEDYNGASMEGASLYQITTKGGKRASTARCYLRPALKRRNLALEMKAQVKKLIIEDGRATGLIYRQHGVDHPVQARREIILAAGAVNSPQILMLSGVGPGAALQANGIDVVHHAAEVGENLQDHVGVDNLFRANTPTLNQVLRPLLSKVMVGVQYLLSGSGPLSISVNQGGGFVKSDPGLERPDLQLYFSPLSYTRTPPGTRPLMSPDPFPGFLLGTNPCKPTSRGRITLHSPDPMAAPAIYPNYLDTDYDRVTTLAGLRLARRMAAAPALAAVIEEELTPGPSVATEDDEALYGYIRDNAWTIFHACGTCRMGADPAGSVVDERLRVHGVAGLRVADASIFPIIPTGNTNAPAIMVGEKASDMILEDAA